jgi:hypothetical protein
MSTGRGGPPKRGDHRLTRGRDQSGIVYADVIEL